MLAPPTLVQRYKEIEKRLRCLEACLEKDVVTGDSRQDKEELQNLELQLYSLNRDLASIADDMACTLFSYYYQAMLSKLEKAHGEAHQ